MRNRRTSVRFPVFGYVIHVVITDDVEKEGQRRNEDLEHAAGGYLTKKWEPFSGCIVLPLKPSPGLVSHEAGHAVWAMLKQTGGRIEEETFCYHLQFVVDRIYKFMGKAK